MAAMRSRCELATLSWIGSLRSSTIQALSHRGHGPLQQEQEV